MNTVLDFYKGKKVLITGHTGFKGSWLSQILLNAGADVYGYALNPSQELSLYSLSKLNENVNSIIGDIRDLAKLKKTFEQIKPEFVFHLAAQPIVKESYKNPVETYSINVMGTVNLLECIRTTHSVQSVVNITTDKVYENKEWYWGYREDDRLNGYDPYSNSKSCSELVTSSYINSFFNKSECKISTARAGNVIGGGDFAPNRIIPDCIRSAIKNEVIVLRNPNSMRPYQHVIEPLSAYLQIGYSQCIDKELSSSYNVGPNEEDCITTGKLADIFCQKWGSDIHWINKSETNAVHEANFLKLDTSKIRSKLLWKPKWSIDIAVQKTIDWTYIWISNGNIIDIMDKQIEVYFSN